MTTVTIPVQGMTCQGCVASVTKALRCVAGVQAVEVSLEQNAATVTFDEGQASVATLRQAIEDAGYDTL